MTLEMSADTLAFYQREADRKSREAQVYGGNAALVELRCFKWYHPDSGSWMTAPDGRDRWLAPKASRIYAILHRVSSSGTGRTSMRAIASEAMVSTSTVSRTVVKLQAFGFFAIDVIRGRNGGIVIRRRTVGDRLRRYASAAWERLRSRINVASTSRGREGDPVLVTSNPITHMDATFSREARLELAGARILSGEITVDEARAALGHRRERPTDADREWSRAEDWARRVIDERRRLDERFPDWDLELEKVRDSLGVG